MRNRVIILVLTSVILLACTCGVPSIIIPAAVTPPTYIPPSRVPVATDYILVTEMPMATATPVHAVTIVRLHPQDGKLISQILAEVPKAAALGQRMFVEFDASW
jgi:hypothetical protein